MSTLKGSSPVGWLVDVSHYKTAGTSNRRARYEHIPTLQAEKPHQVGTIIDYAHFKTAGTTNRRARYEHIPTQQAEKSHQVGTIIDDADMSATKYVHQQERTSCTSADIGL